MRRMWTLVVVAPLALCGPAACGPDGAGIPPAPSGNVEGGGAPSDDEPGFGFNAGNRNGATGDPSTPADGPDKPSRPGGNVSQGDGLDATCGYGTIFGLVCSPNDQVFVNGAKVWVETEDCDTQPITVETLSDNDGYYTLDAVPSGLQTVFVEKGDFTNQYNVLVKNDMLSDVTGVGHKQCFQVVNLCPKGSITGHVCHHDGSPFAGAQVAIDGTGCDNTPEHYEATADGSGNYTFPNLREGAWTVKVAAGGQILTYPVTVAEGQIVSLQDLGYDLCVDDKQCVPGSDNIPVESKIVSGLADIVWFIDTSGSMKQEAGWLQDNINAFAQYIGNADIDYHVVLIAKGYDLCVPPPLGGPGCTNGPNFRHIKEKVGSHDGLEKLIETYPQYQGFLRSGATTNFIAVTDDNSDKSASWFQSQAAQQVNPGFSNPYVFHSIVAYGDIPFIGCFGGAFGGVEYLALTDKTGGAKFPVCETDWSSIFNQMAEKVVDTAVSACAYALPDPVAAANAEQLKVTYFKGPTAEPIPQVSGPEACGPGGGWYLDNPETPSSLLVCPSTCDSFYSGALQLEYTCGGK